MAMNKTEVQGWLEQLPHNARIAIDDGGLCLVVVGDETDYCEVGGVPLPEQESEGPDNGPGPQDPQAGG